MAAESFTALTKNIPLWLHHLDTVTLALVDRRNEAENSPSPDGTLVTGVQQPAPLTDLSQSRGLVEDEGTATAPLPSKSKYQDFQLQQLPKRSHPFKPHRRSSSVLSLDHLGLKYRFGSSASVYYNSDCQKHFELVVRGISNARNALRKAKITARVRVLTNEEAEKENVNKEQQEKKDGDHVHGQGIEEGTGGDGDFPLPAARAKYALERSRIPIQLTNAAKNPADDPKAAPGRPIWETLEAAGNTLERAQSLCEEAADQLLRYGECGTEVNAAKDCFVEALRVAQHELARLSQQKVPDPSPKTIGHTLSPRVSYVTLVQHTEPPATTYNSATFIDVDDDDCENDEFIPPPVRCSNRRSQPVTTR